ncbi:hypothetical protein TNCV_1198191 [Trichonephila clavipes]|uniref:SCY1-like protein 2 n=1 Tax=Trichonephila clavipes TaxID=2585209 RepID=A0A8X6S8R9_TRICX|nr:hypothetical protein TNCV_1198191 [Trichonephila clavipes]
MLSSRCCLQAFVAYPHRPMTLHSLTENSLAVLNHKILEANSQEASVFYFEKKVAEKLHKPKRKETITEILRFSVRQLDRLKHPKLLTLYHPIEESK